MSPVFKLVREFVASGKQTPEINKPAKVQAVDLSGKLPLVNATFGKNLIFSGLLDSGSSRSLVSKDFFLKLKKEKCIKKVVKVNYVMKVANGGKMSINQGAQIHFKIGNFSWTYEFWIVKNLPFNFILGFDFWKFSKLRLDMAERKIKFDFDQSETCFCILDEEVSKSEKHNVGNCELSDQEKDELSKLQNEYRDVLTKRIGKARTTPYKLRIKGNPEPIRCRPFQMNPERLGAARKIIDELLDQGIIQKSNSEWGANSFLVEKREKGKFRLVVNYKKLNQHIEFDSYPCPVVDTMFQHMKDGRIFSSLDLSQSFHQIPLHPDSIKYTTFNTCFGSYSWNRLPMGIKIGSQALSRFVDEVLGDLKYSCVLNFVDDIVIWSKDVQSHMRDLREVLTRLRNSGLTVNPDKVSLAKKGVRFLGHIVTDGKLLIDDSRIEPIANYPVPKTLKQVQRFVGMCGFYAKFIKDFSRVCAPLNNLKRKGVKFRWTPETQKSFETLKMALISPPVLHLPDYDREFFVSSDASEKSIGAVLEQKYLGKSVPVAYASRTLTGSELQYGVYRKEFLAAIFACERFRPILLDRKFTLRTDCQAIAYVMNSDKETGQMARWKLRLSTFNCDVVHARASENVVGDALSRMFEGTDESDKPKAEESNNSGEECNILQFYPECFQSIGKKQREDPNLSPIIQQLESGAQVQNFSLRNNILKYRKNARCPPKIVVPQAMREMIIKYYHESVFSAHWGIHKTVAKITKLFTWENMFQEIKHFVRSCDLCQLSKPSQNQKIGLMASKVPEKPFERLHIDFFGPLTRSASGNSYILTAIDSFSKFVFLTPLRKATAESTIKALKDRIFAQYGLPECIVSDNGSQFTAEMFKSFLYGLGIKHITTSVAHPNPNQAERTHRNLRQILKIYHSCTQNKWDENLAYLSIAFNSAQSEATGVTPAYAFTGREFSHPLQLLWNLDDEDVPQGVQTEERVRKIAEQLKRTHQKTKAQYDRNRRASPYSVGDKVMYKRFVPSNKAKKISNKLTQIWRGPFTIIQVVNEVNIKIQLDSDPEQVRVVHVSQVKKYYER